MQLDSNQISQVLPHRYPFALVDRITDGEEWSWARCIKCVSVQEPVVQVFLGGHKVVLATVGL